MRACCERGAEIARLIGLSAATASAIRGLDEHWDGHGQPEGLRGDEIPLAGGSSALRRRSRSSTPRAGSTPRCGSLAAQRRMVRPALSTRCTDALRRGVLGLAAGGRAGPWEPRERRLTADEAYLDRIADAFAGVVDAKSPWTYRHSDRTCVIA